VLTSTIALPLALKFWTFSPLRPFSSESGVMLDWLLFAPPLLPPVLLLLPVPLLLLLFPVVPPLLFWLLPGLVWLRDGVWLVRDGVFCVFWFARVLPGVAGAAALPAPGFGWAGFAPTPLPPLLLLLLPVPLVFWLLPFRLLRGSFCVP